MSVPYEHPHAISMGISEAKLDFGIAGGHVGVREASSGARCKMLHWQNALGETALACGCHGMGMLMSSAALLAAGASLNKTGPEGERRPCFWQLTEGHIEVWTSCKAVAS